MFTSSEKVSLNFLMFSSLPQSFINFMNLNCFFHSILATSPYHRRIMLLYSQVSKSTTKQRYFWDEGKYGLDAPLLTSWINANPGWRFYRCGMYKVLFFVNLAYLVHHVLIQFPWKCFYVLICIFMERKSAIIVFSMMKRWPQEQGNWLVHSNKD